MSTPTETHATAAIRAGCGGEPPLSARLEPWMVELLAEPAGLDSLLELHGSPLNLHQLDAFGRNAAEISTVVAEFGLDAAIFFARKANKCLAFAERARELGLGVDVAGERELRQTLAAGVAAERIVLTAAIKPEPLLRLCIEAGVTVAVDSRDELERIAELLADSPGRELPVALRLTPGRLDPARPRSRFGLDLEAAIEAATIAGGGSGLRIAGVHFHLDGYSADERAATVGESLELVDRLREQGHAPGFIDIGGGFPISYLDDREQWRRFWAEHRRALLGEREPLTFSGHGLGMQRVGDEIVGRPALYPYWQEPVRGEWLRGLLDSPTEVAGRSTRVANAIAERRLQLRCEPGRALMDGCGVTAARVEQTKPHGDGTTLAGLAMNRTQCRTSSDDFLVDPLLVRGQRAASPSEGYLVGAYCIERELLSWRRLRFPQGIARGDIVVFPNTAGYFMHILESSSHQLPLARNLVLEPSGSAARPDAIDSLGSAV